MHVDSDIRFTRRLHRDVKERGRSLESVIAQYYETVRPMYQKYLDPQKQFADFTVGEETDVAAEILASRLEDFLSMRPKNFLRISLLGGVGEIGSNMTVFETAITNISLWITGFFFLTMTFSISIT